MLENWGRLINPNLIRSPIYTAGPHLPEITAADTSLQCHVTLPSVRTHIKHTTPYSLSSWPQPLWKPRCSWWGLVACTERYTGCPSSKVTQWGAETSKDPDTSWEETKSHGCLQGTWASSFQHSQEDHSQDPGQAELCRKLLPTKNLTANCHGSPYECLFYFILNKVCNIFLPPYTPAEFHIHDVYLIFMSLYCYFFLTLN